jgi:putative ABC transport system permease protein
MVEKLFPVTEEFQAGIELFFLSGIMLVTATVWLVVYNADLLSRAIVLLLGRVRGLPPILKTAISYPMEHRFRTGMTLAMFSLVVFTLIVMAFILHASAGLFSDPDKLTGGFHIQADVSYSNPIWDIEEAIARTDGLSPGDFEAVASFTGLPVKIKQADTGQDWADFYVSGVNAGYTDNISYDIALKAEGYDSPADVWSALQSEPGTAVVSAYLVPARENYSFGAPQTFTLEGFYFEDNALPDVFLEVENTITGTVDRLKVIGVVELGAFYGRAITTSQATLAGMVGQPLPPTAFWFDVKDGVDVDDKAKTLEARFLENGLQAEVLAEEIERNSRTQLMVNSLLQGFMGLGLVVGIAALGVIAARSVVERRHEIGMIRAIGFQRFMVQSSFLIESSFVALLGIAIGVALGMGISVQVIGGMKESFPGIEYNVPVSNVLTVVFIAYVASLVTTFIPSVQASRVYPAEALRYE